MSDSVTQVRQAYAAQIQCFFADESQAKDSDRLLMQHSWPFETFALPSLVESQHRQGLPQAVLEAYDYYKAEVMDQDWGMVHGVTLLVGDCVTFAIYVETDGSDGWLEVFDLEGQLLGAARTELGTTTWGERSQIRSQISPSS